MLTESGHGTSAARNAPRPVTAGPPAGRDLRNAANAWRAAATPEALR